MPGMNEKFVITFVVIIMMASIVILQLSEMTADSAGSTEVEIPVKECSAGGRSGNNTSAVEIVSIPRSAIGDFIIRLKVDQSVPTSPSYVVFSSVDGGEWNVLPVEDYLILNRTSISIHGSRLERGATDFGISLTNSTVPESVSTESVEVSVPDSVAGSGGTDSFDPGYMGYVLVIAGIIIIGGISLFYKAGTDQIKSIMDQLPPPSKEKADEKTPRRRTESSYEARGSQEDIGWDSDGSVGWDEETRIPKEKRDRGRRTEMGGRHERRTERADRRTDRAGDRSDRVPPRGRRSGTREDRVERSGRRERQRSKDEAPPSERQRHSRGRPAGRYGERHPGDGEGRRKERKHRREPRREDAGRADRDGPRRGRDRKRRYEETRSRERPRRRKPESRYDRESDDWDVEYEDPVSRYSEDDMSWLN